MHLFIRISILCATPYLAGMGTGQSHHARQDNSSPSANSVILQSSEKNLLTESRRYLYQVSLAGKYMDSQRPGCGRAALLLLKPVAQRSDFLCASSQARLMIAKIYATGKFDGVSRNVPKAAEQCQWLLNPGTILCDCRRPDCTIHRWIRKEAWICSTIIDGMSQGRPQLTRSQSDTKINYKC